MLDMSDLMIRAERSHSELKLTCVLLHYKKTSVWFLLPSIDTHGLHGNTKKKSLNFYYLNPGIYTELNIHLSQYLTKYFFNFEY